MEKNKYRFVSLYLFNSEAFRIAGHLVNHNIMNGNIMHANCKLC